MYCVFRAYCVNGGFDKYTTLGGGRGGDGWACVDIA